MNGRSKQDTPRLPFFVYGTLLPGQPNAFLWQGMETHMEPARLDNGRLHDMGGYPMLVEAGANPVKGQIITIAHDFYEQVMARLDFLEGYDPFRPDLPGYHRVIRNVIMANGRTAPAWVYIGQLEWVNGRVLISNGDWVAYIRQKNQPRNEWPPANHPFNSQDI
jgi:gamma-glutamylcyclotransferase (GGCT)/AIG2-like uncharacterized protein YtfP